MNEPSRWRDSGPDDLRQLLRHAQSSRAITREDKARTARRFARAAAAPAVFGLILTMKGLALGAAVGLVAATSMQMYATRAQTKETPSEKPVLPQSKASEESAALHPSPSAATSSLSSSPVAASAPHDSPAGPLPNPAGARSFAEPPRPQSVASVPPTPAMSEQEPDSLAREAAMLERARAALGRHPVETIHIVDQHAAEFPHGKLGAEGELLAIDALQRLGRSKEARDRGERLLLRPEGSLYVERIRSMLQQGPLPR